MEWTRIYNDTNGNPRYVVHFLDVEPAAWKHYNATLAERYARVCKLMNKAGGRKYHNRQYGGGIVFQTYNLKDIERHIKELLENQE